MNREENVLAMIRAALQDAAADLTGYRVVLFGSRARGQARSRSDFDIGVLGNTPLPLGTFFRLAERFEQMPTLYSVDWVDLQRTSPVFRQSAIEQAITLHE
jgi:predicted nucleotidyltransferase